MQTRFAAVSAFAVVLSGTVLFAQPSPGPRGPRAGRPEMQAHRQQILDKYDVNKDGQLDESERATLHADIEAGKVQPPAGRGPRGPGAPGGRGPNPELVKQYDANGDGVLDEAERAALRSDIQSGKVERPTPKRERRGPGRRPFGGNPDAEPPAVPPQE